MRPVAISFHRNIGRQSCFCNTFHSSDWHYEWLFKISERKENFWDKVMELCLLSLSPKFSSFPIFLPKVFEVLLLHPVTSLCIVDMSKKVEILFVQSFFFSILFFLGAVVVVVVAFKMAAKVTIVLLSCKENCQVKNRHYVLSCIKE